MESENISHPETSQMQENLILPCGAFSSPSSQEN